MSFRTAFTLLFLVFVALAYAKKDEQPQWIAPQKTDTFSADVPQFFYYRKSFKLKKAPVQSCIRISSLNSYNLWINGVPVVLDGNSYDDNGILCTDSLILPKYLIKGDNHIAIMTRYLPKQNIGKDEKIRFQIYKQDTLSIVSDKTWSVGMDHSMQISMNPTYTISYSASEDIFNGFNDYYYNTEIRGKDFWQEAMIINALEPESNVSKYVEVVKTLKVHNYKATTLPVFLKDEKTLNWNIDFSKPVYFGFSVETVANKKIQTSLKTKEFGRITFNYETMEGAQEFYLRIPLTIDSVEIHFPAYIKVNNLSFKEIQYLD